MKQMVSISGKCFTRHYQKLDNVLLQLVFLSLEKKSLFEELKFYSIETLKINNKIAHISSNKFISFLILKMLVLFWTKKKQKNMKYIRNSIDIIIFRLNSYELFHLSLFLLRIGSQTNDKWCGVKFIPLLEQP